MAKSIFFDTKSLVWKSLKAVAEDAVVNDFLVIDHTFDISKVFRYKQTPIGVLKSGGLYFTRKDHPQEYYELTLMKNYKI